MKKLLSLLLCVALVLTTFTVVFADTVTIATKDDLVAMIQGIGADGGAGKTYKLTADIDLGGADWAGIGSQANPFKGTFDGNGHIIKNYKLSIPVSHSYDNWTFGVGLFNYISGNAVIKNLGVENIEVSSEANSWRECAGGIVAIVDGSAKISGCYAKNITNTDTTGADMMALGGIAAATVSDNVVIENCYSTNADYQAGVDYDAGIIGAGNKFLKIENCYSTKSIARVDDTSYHSKVVNCYYTGALGWPTDKYVGTLITTDQLKTYYTTLGSAFVKGSASNSGYPAFSWEAVAEAMQGDGSENNPYIIANYDNLVEVATMTNTDGKYFKLTTDIDMENRVWSNYIGSQANAFKGIFDGNGHIVKNYKLVIPVSHSYDNWTFGVGLFGYIGGDAEIKNLGVENIEVSSAQNSWRECAGGIVAIVDDNAKISGCYAKNITNKDLTDPDMMALGGIAAATVGEGVVIENCYTISNDYRELVDYDGGIVGYGMAFSKIENCYSTNGIVRAEKTMEEKVVNCCYVGAMGWPIGDTESSQTYHGEKISVVQLRANASKLGSAFKKGGVETKGYPALSWENITEITLVTTDTEVEENVTNFVYLTKFNFTDGDEIVLSFADSTGDQVEIMSLNDSEITVGRKFNAGTIKKGDYKVVADFDFSSKVILLTITMPDGSIYKRGDAELLCGKTRADMVSITSTKADAVSNAFVYMAKPDEVKEIVFEEEPQFDGFDALVYNFSSSYDVDAKTTRNFAWMADLSFDAMDVMYKAEGETEWQTVNAVREEAQTAQYQYAYYYKADLKGLTPGTTYTYKYGKAGSTAEADWSREYTFTTEKENVKEFNFAAVADTQGKTWDGEFKYTKEVMDAIKDVNPALIMHAGDIVEVAGNDDQWPPFFKAIKDVAHGTPFFFATGNHDTWSNEQWDSSPMNKDFMFGLHFNHPNNGGMAAIKDLTPEDLNVANKSGRRLVENMDETVYSYDYGDVHFVVLNSGTALGGSYGYADDDKILKAQRDWLIADLEANKDAKWTVLMMHQPVYAQFFNHESKTVITDIIDQYEIDLVLTGHDHSVSRTHAVRNGEIVDKGEIGYIKKGEGTVYSILGAVTPLHRNHISDYDEIYEENMLSVGPDDTIPVYTVINVTDEKLEVTTKMLNGFVVDNYKIVADEIQIAGLTRFNGEKVNTIADLAIDGYADLGFYYNGGDVKDLAVMAAYYDADNKLVGIHKLENTTTTAEEDLYSYEFIPADINGVEEIRFFVWDTTNSLMPITKKVFSLK